MNFNGSPAALKIRTEQPVVFLKEFALSPLIYLRLVGILFSIIVFGCMSDKGIVKKNNAGDSACLYNGSGACNYAIGIGVIAFLICIAFLFKDVAMVVVDFSGYIIAKTGIIILDLIVNGFWCFLWFVCFCYTTDQYRKTEDIFKSNYSASVTNCLRATITFSFFSVILWIAIIVFNVLFLIWILRGTDRDCRGLNAAGQEGDNDAPENYDDEEEKKMPQGGDNYTPPEY
ncbi:PREDICTED: synaptogyrin-3-like [Amphimedon queenslandica]|uniref:MARVEL domain-containing protein n=1 Tax=Amphimedon queenslandica TaxID=400682 RepID=A0A1X7US79_AMPQE|nr:PREDICTED: synaptogyrin-3-like [Amphimedon queenslandica]|eukprot:XP_003386894.1 PREDICTED: synaptogyrin-3-like [Amphimedon queenslandica]